MKIINLKSFTSLLLLTNMLFFFTCSNYAYKTIYNQLDFILYLEVKKYFHPDDNQKQFVKQRLASLLKWSRKNMLPQFRNILFSMKTSVSSGLTENDLIYLFNTLDREFEILAEKAAPDAAEFVLTLNRDQLENYQQEVNNHREEDKKKNKPEEENSPAKRTESAVKLLSNFYGSFSDEQQEKIKSYIEVRKATAFNRLEYQNIKQKEFIELINKKASKDKMTLFLKNWIIRDPESTPADYLESFKARRKFNIDLYLYVDQNIVTAEQRVKAIETFDKWIETTNTLIEEN